MIISPPTPQKKADYGVRYTLENMEANIYQLRDLILIVHNTEIDAACLGVSALAIQEQVYDHKRV